MAAGAPAKAAGQLGDHDRPSSARSRPKAWSIEPDARSAPEGLAGLIKLHRQPGPSAARWPRRSSAEMIDRAAKVRPRPSSSKKGLTQVSDERRVGVACCPGDIRGQALQGGGGSSRAARKSSWAFSWARSCKSTKGQANPKLVNQLIRNNAGLGTGFRN